MQNVINPVRDGSVPWFRKWFNTTWYHRLYMHRSDEEAAAFIDALLGELALPAAATVLDLGCGNGRHCRQVAKSFPVTGLDIAPASIREARKKKGSNMQFYVHDMRLPFGVARYDCVLNLFTSFGYFETPSEHLTVLNNMASALKRGGTLVLDYLNIYPAEKNMVEQEKKEIDGIVYDLKRWTDDAYFYKQIRINDGSDANPPAYTEKVAKFNLAAFNNMFATCGLKIENVYGNYRLDTFNPDQSPRLIMVAKKIN